MKDVKRRNGGRSKRKPETNYVDPSKGPSTLPPPPTMRDVAAVPAKLRKIMQMKALAADGHGKSEPKADDQSQDGKRSSKSLSKTQKNNPAGKGSACSVVNDLRITSPDIDSKRNVNDSMSIAAKRKSTKRERDEAELSTLIQKMDQQNKTGLRKGAAPRRKSYLDAKKRKKGQQNATELDPALDFHQHDKVEFGEIVQAPPKLSFPATTVRVRPELLNKRSIDYGNPRLQAIAAYRFHKGLSYGGGLGGA